jgi:hypothetical protein
MLVLAVPMILWATQPTVISAMDVAKSVAPAIAAILAGAGAVGISWTYTGSIEWTFIRLIVESAVLFGTYWLVLLFGFRQHATYLTVFRELRIFPPRVKGAETAVA